MSAQHRPAALPVQLERTTADHRAGGRPGHGRRRFALGPGQDQGHALEQDAEAARLLDKIHGAALKRRLLVDLIAEHGQEDHRNRQAALAHTAQHLDAAQARHLPVEQHQGDAAVHRQQVQGGLPRGHVDHRKTGFVQIVADRFPERIVVIDQQQPGCRRQRPLGGAHGAAVRTEPTQASPVNPGSPLGLASVVSTRRDWLAISM